MFKKQKKEAESVEVSSAEFSLLPDEKVTQHLGSFYITNKRLVRYRKTFKTMRIADWQYDHVKGVQELDVHPFLLLSIWVGIALFIWWHIFYWVNSLQVALVCIAIASLGLLYKQRRVVIMFRDHSMVHVPPKTPGECDRFAQALRKLVYK